LLMQSSVFLPSAEGNLLWTRNAPEIESWVRWIINWFSFRFLQIFGLWIRRWPLFFVCRFCNDSEPHFSFQLWCSFLEVLKAYE
jgi:hypothetical protein